MPTMPQPDVATQTATPPSWSALMVAAQGGDAHAYESLLRSVLPLLRAVAGQRLADDGDVEDAVQDTLLTIHQLRHTYRAPRPLRPWIVAICEHRCIERKREAGRRVVDRAQAARPTTVLEAPASVTVASAQFTGGEPRESAVRSPVRLTGLEQRSPADPSVAAGRSVAASVQAGARHAIPSLRRLLAWSGAVRGLRLPSAARRIATR
jgi:RNA polymerase sigma-70 factor, ECF subfamily